MVAHCVLSGLDHDSSPFLVCPESRASRSSFSRDFLAVSASRLSATWRLTQSSSAAARFSARESGCGLRSFPKSVHLLVHHPRRAGLRHRQDRTLLCGRGTEIDVMDLLMLATGTPKRLHLMMRPHRLMRFAARQVGSAAALFAFGRAHDLFHLCLRRRADCRVHLKRGGREGR